MAFFVRGRKRLKAKRLDRTRSNIDARPDGCKSVACNDAQVNNLREANALRNNRQYMTYKGVIIFAELNLALYTDSCDESLQTEFR
jgi:hypothetical protein